MGQTHEVTIFGIELTLKEVAFSIGGWNIYWYGILIGIGCLIALIYGMKNAERLGIDKDRMLDVVLVTIPVAVLCARAYYCIFPEKGMISISSVREFFGLDSGGFSGLAIYGGIIGAFVFGSLMCKLRKVKILDMFDLASLGFLIGQTIGRWGNFVNQEAFGSQTGSSWFGMMSKATGMKMVHPCFLYESIWCLIGFFLLHYFSKKRKFSGQIFLMYGIWYGFGRFFIEIIRTDSLMIGQMKVSVLVSGLAVLICTALLIYLLSKSKRQAIVGNQYESLFAQQFEETEQEEENEEAQEQE